ncbi:MAG: hypothetical protein V1692_00140 [bacterium]
MAETKNEQLPISWQVPEYVQHERGRYWYLLAILAILGLLVYAVFSANFFLIIIMILTIVIMFVSSRQAAPQVQISLTDDGLAIGQKFYPYNELSVFWIINEKTDQPVLYVDFKSFLRPHLDIPLIGQDPLLIREIFLKHVAEDLDREGEPLLDFLSRFLKI